MVRSLRNRGKLQGWTGRRGLEPREEGGRRFEKGGETCGGGKKQVKKRKACGVRCWGGGMQLRVNEKEVEWWEGGGDKGKKYQK